MTLAEKKNKKYVDYLCDEKVSVPALWCVEKGWFDGSLNQLHEYLGVEDAAGKESFVPLDAGSLL